MANGMKALLGHAGRLAKRRSQRVTTAHLLLSLYQRSALGELLAEHGVSELGLIAALGTASDEHENVLSFAVERAEKAAAGSHASLAHGLALLTALAREPRSLAYRCLERLGVSPARLLDAAGQRYGDAGALRPVRVGEVERARTSGHALRAKRTQLALRAQQRLAIETERKRALRTARRESFGDQALDSVALGAIAEPVAESSPSAPHAATGSPSRREPAARSSPRAEAATQAVVNRFALDPERFPLLTSLGRNLCQLALEGRIDPVIGRDAEIEQVLDVLARRRANNPILVGPPGVGKTAIAEGVALALVHREHPASRARVLCELSAPALLAGTSVRGALSERLQSLAQEIALAEGRVVAFIDEIHALVGGEDAPESAASALKAALARGELPCLGATTLPEYRRIFERDAALARRFTRIDVDEPKPAAALAILEGLAPEYEKHHRVSYAPDALAAAVELSVRFISERILPDKAIGLIDQAAARVRRRGAARVDREAVAEVVAEHCGVPLARLLMRDGEALLALEAALGERVVGQDDCARAIADALRKGAAGFRGARPLGTFLFLGPTGVGKTEMAKAIAEHVFPKSPITRIDMSELSEPHAVARLIGAPPGYLGHDDGGQLTEAVRARPYQLVLLDEIEKAHRDVLLALLPLLDEGQLTDARGRRIDFTNTVIAMTSNLGAEPREARARVGFGDAATAAEDLKRAALAAARRALPPELWNRIDEPLFFAPLAREAVERIAVRMLAQVVASMQREHGVALAIEPSAIHALIAAGGYDPALGARPMRRTVGRLLESALARGVLSGELARGDSVVVRGRQDQIELERERGADAAE